MKKAAYEHSKLKKDLALRRQRGIKVVIWKMSDKKKGEVEELGYRVEPYLYAIRTRTFKNIRNLNSTLLKDLHHMKKNGKDLEVRMLKHGDKEVLDKYGIKYYPIKYKIYLT